MGVEGVWSSTARLAVLGPSALSAGLRYFLAIGLTILAYWVRLLIAPQEMGLPYVTFFPAATLSAIFCGVRPALVATLLSVTLATYTFMPPFNTVKVESHALLTALVFFFDELIVCIGIEAMRHYYKRSLAATAALYDANRSEEAARRAAERANQAKSRFLAAASHDLRQPLQALRLYHAALQGQVNLPTVEQVLDHMDIALTASEELLHSLLDVSVIEAGTVKPKPVDIEVADFLSALELRHRLQAEAKGLRFRLRPSLGRLHADPVLLGRVLDNLVSNAIRYTERGRIMVACRRRRGRMRFEVWDTGIGISPEHVDSVFEEFFQVGNSARNRSMGSGLGLAVVQKTASLIGGEVTLRSRLGRGSCFMVTLPL